MNKKNSLTDIDLQRLAELVNTYLKPSERFSINGKGEISLAVKSWWARLLKRNSEDHLDFLEVVTVIYKGIMDVKGAIPFIATTCDGSIDILVETNDRSTVIARQRITVESKQRMLLPHETIFRNENMGMRNLKEDICAIMNGRKKY